jgi:hypothetical protein
MKNELTVTEVVEKIIGKVDPVGETNADNERLENLKALCELTQNLLEKIKMIAYKNIEAKEFSVKRAGEYATEFMKENGIHNPLS